MCVPDGVTEIGNAAFVKVIPGIGTRTLEGLDFIREVTLPEWTSRFYLACSDMQM